MVHPRSANDESREIVVNTFDEKHAQKFREQVLRLADHGPDIIIPVYIDSYGGYVDSLAKMLETMDSVPNRFITICQGKAMSCGAILLSHGDVRWCGKLSRVMIHNISSASWGDVTELKSRSDECERMNRVFMELLAQNCGKTYDELQEAIRSTTDSKNIWLSPEEAFSFGIIDKVGTPVIHPIVQFVLDAAPEKDRLTDGDKGVKRAKKKKTTRRKAKTKKKI
jgi:ATP-dependent Clp protease protease subunit